MPKFALAFAAATIIAAPALAAAPTPAQDYRANRIACAKEMGGSRIYRHGRYGWRLHHMAQSQAYMDCLTRRAGGGAGVSAR
jgi:hypothetical protein